MTALVFWDDGRIGVYPVSGPRDSFLARTRDSMERVEYHDSGKSAMASREEELSRRHSLDLCSDVIDE